MYVFWPLPHSMAYKKTKPSKKDQTPKETKLQKTQSSLGAKTTPATQYDLHIHTLFFIISIGGIWFRRSWLSCGFITWSCCLSWRERYNPTSSLLNRIHSAKIIYHVGSLNTFKSPPAQKKKNNHIMDPREPKQHYQTNQAIKGNIFEMPRN